MKKEEVYKLIEYDGIYNDKVKKNLKELIKKYHPDRNNGDNKIIKVIYDVKKELENNKVSYNPKNINKEKNLKKEKFIDEKECLINIERLNKENKKIEKDINNKYLQLSKLFQNYSDLYDKSNTYKNKYCEIKDKIDYINNNNVLEILIYIILVITIFVSIINASYLYLVIMLIIMIGFGIGSYFHYKNNKSLKENLEKLLEKSKKINSEVSNMQDSIKKLTDQIHSLERKQIRIKNDIRFYENMKK